MSTAWIRKYESSIASGAARHELAARVCECDVKGCTNLVMDGTRCERCCDEIRSLKKMMQQGEERKATRRERHGERIAGVMEFLLVCRDCCKEYGWIPALILWGYVGALLLFGLMQN
jgi:hypothetical protein